MIRVRIAEAKDKTKWDEFVRNAANGTIFHQIKFLDYHERSKFDFHHLIFEDSGEIKAVLPGCINRSSYISPAGSSYGSLVYNNLSFCELEAIIDVFVDYLKIHSFKEACLTFAPIIYSDCNNETDKFLLQYNGFKVSKQLISHAIKLKVNSEEDILKSLTGSCRRAVKKSFQYNLHIEINDDYHLFYDMLVENKKKFNTVPTHTYDELLRLKELFPNEIKLIMAYNEKKQPVAGILFFICNSRCVLMFYICHYYEFQNSRAINRLFFELTLWATKRKYQWLDMGVSMDTFSENPMEPSRNLITFKESMGSQGFLRSTYRWLNDKV